LSCPKIVSKRADSERSRPAKRPRERPAPYCFLKAHQVGMQVCTPARQSLTGVGDKRVPGHHQAKEF